MNTFQIFLSIWPFILIIIIIFIILGIYQIISGGKKEELDLSVYERKPFLFDTTSEFNLYKILFELFGNKYYIFPQINYSHLIQPKKSTFSEERKLRSRIDRKSADFVFCDKARIIPRLIIELDGGVHNFKNKQARDEFINSVTQIVDLPLLHLKNTDFKREFIQIEVNKKLNNGL